MFVRFFDLLGVAIFAISGALAAIAAQLDLLGIFVLATATAIGGGTVRDLLLNRHPIFWLRDSWPIISIVFGTLLCLLWVHFLPVPTGALLVADAFGLALFAMSGARIAEDEKCHALVVILMGTLTGAGGGVLRDLLSAKVPLILRQDIYASAAMLGIAVYLILRQSKLPDTLCLALGFATVAATRLIALAYDLKLPGISAIAA